MMLTIQSSNIAEITIYIADITFYAEVISPQVVLRTHKVSVHIALDRSNRPSNTRRRAAASIVPFPNTSLCKSRVTIVAVRAALDADKSLAQHSASCMHPHIHMHLKRGLYKGVPAQHRLML